MNDLLPGELPPEAVPDVPMVNFRGMWLPAGESHLQRHIAMSPEVDGRGTYQLVKLKAALQVTESRGVAVDVGAHVGLWSRILAREFKAVHAFEPVPWHRACWARNMAGHRNATLHPMALSDRHATLSLSIQTGNSGSTHVAADGAGQVEARAVPLDDVQGFGPGRHEPPADGAGFYPEGTSPKPLQVDFLKADCEGWEEYALRGAIETLKRCWPVVVVEQKPGHAERAGLRPQGAVLFLGRALGYRVHTILSGDYIMVPPGNGAFHQAQEVPPG